MYGDSNRENSKSNPSLLLRTTGRLRHVMDVAMHVPRHALVRNLGMLAQIVQRIGRRSWIDALDRILRCLEFSLMLHSLAAIQDGEVVMGSQIVGIDRLQSFELSNRIVGSMFLIVRDSQFAPGISAFRKLGDYFFKGSNFRLRVTCAPLNKRHVVQRSRIVGMERESLLERRSCFVILFPVDVG